MIVFEFLLYVLASLAEFTTPIMVGGILNIGQQGQGNVSIVVVDAIRRNACNL